MDILCETVQAVISTQWDQTVCLLRSVRCPKSGISLVTAHCSLAFKLSLGHARSPRHDPPLRPSLPEWGSTNVEGDLFKKKKQKQTPATKETKPTRPQAAFQTPKSDVRTIDMQSDLDTTPLSTVNKYYRSWLIPITINKISTLALLDTSVTCTMIVRPLYETLQDVQPLKLKRDEDLRLKVIGGGAAPTLGTTTVRLLLPARL